jgi:hypothetical protein
MPFKRFLLTLAVLLAAASTRAQNDATSASSSGATKLDPVVVTEELDETRGLIEPSLGATSFIIDQQQLLNLPQGEDAPFNQVLLRAPGVA